MSHHRTFAILTAEPVPPRRKPRHRSDKEKAQLVAEAFSPGGNVSACAFRGAGSLAALCVAPWREEPDGVALDTALDDQQPALPSRLDHPLRPIMGTSMDPQRG